MDPEDIRDRFPTGGVRDRLPGVGGAEDPDEQRSADEPDDDGPLPTVETPDRSGLRRLLLAFAGAGATLAVLAVLLRRLLGGSDEPEDDTVEVDSWTDDETDEGDDESTDAGDDGADAASDDESVPAPDAEAVAAGIGLGLQLILKALVDDESDSPTG